MKILITTLVLAAQTGTPIFRFEADGSELASQLLVSGTRVRTPVVLVEVHEDVEHEMTIPQRFVRRPLQG